jgi:DNA-binding transcriptional regulator/RsmH inhibitor MraZ
MVLHTCKNCGKEFKRKDLYNYHINRKFKCIKKTNNSIEKENTKKKKKCKYCYKEMIIQKINVHYRLYCKKIPNKDKLEYIDKFNKNKRTKNKINFKINIEINSSSNKCDNNNKIYISNKLGKRAEIEKNIKNINSNKYFQKIYNLNEEQYYFFSGDKNDYDTIIKNLLKYKCNMNETNFKNYVCSIIKIINKLNSCRNFYIINKSTLKCKCKHQNTIKEYDLNYIIEIKVKRLISFLISIINTLKLKLIEQDMNDILIDEFNNRLKRLDLKNKKVFKFFINELKTFFINENLKNKEIFKEKLKIY